MSGKKGAKWKKGIIDPSKRIKINIVINDIMHNKLIALSKKEKMTVSAAGRVYLCKGMDIKSQGFNQWKL